MPMNKQIGIDAMGKERDEETKHDFARSMI